MMPEEKPAKREEGIRMAEGMGWSLDVLLGSVKEGVCSWFAEGVSRASDRQVPYREAFEACMRKKPAAREEVP